MTKQIKMRNGKIRMLKLNLQIFSQ